MANVNKGPQYLSRRDFLKLGGATLGALGLAPFTPLFEGQRPTEVFDPHSLVPIYPWNTGTGLLIDSKGTLQRSEPPPANIEKNLQRTLEIFVPWTGPMPQKPDAPIGVCTFTNPITKDHVEAKLIREPSIKFEMSNDEPPAHGTSDIRTLEPHFDQLTGNTFVTNKDGLVIRVIPPPMYQQGLADGKFTANIPYHALKPGYFDIPYPPGWCVIRTPDGKETTTALQYARSIKLV